MRHKLAVPMLLLLLLCACGADNISAQTPVQFRTGVAASGCRFQAHITGDYGEYVREFTLECICQKEETCLTVLEPEVAQGIRATVSGEEAKVEFADTILAVEEFAERQISPMAAPYVLFRAWTEGYVSSVGQDGELEQVTYLLGYGQEQLMVTTCFSGRIPVKAWVSCGEKDLIVCEISDFSGNN